MGKRLELGMTYVGRSRASAGETLLETTWYIAEEPSELPSPKNIWQCTTLLVFFYSVRSKEQQLISKQLY